MFLKVQPVVLFKTVSLSPVPFFAHHPTAHPPANNLLSVSVSLSFYFFIFCFLDFT